MVFDWFLGVFNMFSAVTETFRSDVCQEQIICEAYQRNFFSDNILLSVVSPYFVYFPSFVRARNVAGTRSGCSNYYAECIYLNKVLYTDNEVSDKELDEKTNDKPRRSWLNFSSPFFIETKNLICLLFTTM